MLLFLVVGTFPLGAGAVDDGQYDYGNPYLTLDPETGELVEVDPRADAASAAVGHGATSGSSEDTDASRTSWLLLAGIALIVVTASGWLFSSRFGGRSKSS